jgi:hypothetical protein
MGRRWKEGEARQRRGRERGTEGGVSQVSVKSGESQALSGRSPKGSKTKHLMQAVPVFRQTGRGNLLRSMLNGLYWRAAIA